MLISSCSRTWLICCRRPQLLSPTPRPEQGTALLTLCHSTCWEVINLNGWFSNYTYVYHHRPTIKKTVGTLPFIFHMTEFPPSLLFLPPHFQTVDISSLCINLGCWKQFCCCLWSWVMIADDNWHESLGTSGLNQTDWTCWSIRRVPQSLWTRWLREICGRGSWWRGANLTGPSCCSGRIFLHLVLLESKREKIREWHGEIKWKVRSPGGKGGKKAQSGNWDKAIWGMCWAEDGIMNSDHIWRGEWGRAPWISHVWGIRNRYYISGTAAPVAPAAPSPSDNMFLTGFPPVPPGLVTISQSVCLQTDNQPLISTRCHGGSPAPHQQLRYVKNTHCVEGGLAVLLPELAGITGISNPCGTCFLCLGSQIWSSLWAALEFFRLVLFLKYSKCAKKTKTFQSLGEG